MFSLWSSQTLLNIQLYYYYRYVLDSPEGFLWNKSLWPGMQAARTEGKDHLSCV